MKKRIAIITILVLMLMVGGAVIYILRPSQEASVPIEAVPLDANSTQTSGDVNNKIDAQLLADNPQGVTIFSIDQENTVVSFTLDEILREVPTTVVGKTNQVAGEIAVNPVNPENSHVEKILVNARTLITDNNFRYRAINNEILKTGEFEFIIFSPKVISGIPDNPQLGEEMIIQIVSDLTIRDITQEITFDGVITVMSETNMTGYASVEIARADFNIVIPQVPGVANVDEEVLLEIEFSATAK